MTDHPPDPDLAWLATTLFNLEDGSAGSRAQTLRFDPDGAWLALPLRGPVRRLVPVEPAAARAAFTNRHDAMGRARRLAGAIAEQAAARGATGLIRARRVAVADGLGVGGDPARSILARLAQGGATPSGSRRAEVAGFAITLGPRRHNRKPVLQLIGPGGEILGFAKVAADDLTGALVTNEEHWLRSVQAAFTATPEVDVPAVLDSFSWTDRPVVVLEAIGPTRPVAGRADRLARIVEAVSRVDAPKSVAHPPTDPLVEIGLLADFGPPAGISADSLDRACERISAALDTEVPLGPWHGDLTPWNMISGPDRTWVLDWEMARTGQPVGADLIHHRVMVAAHLKDRPIPAALAEARSSAPMATQPGEIADAMFVRYLAELVRRDLELAGHDVAATGFGAAAVAMLAEGVR